MSCNCIESIIVYHGDSLFETFKFEDESEDAFDLSSSTGEAQILRGDELILVIPLTLTFISNISDNIEFAMTVAEVRSLEPGDYKVEFKITSVQKSLYIPNEGEIELSVKEERLVSVT